MKPKFIKKLELEYKSKKLYNNFLLHQKNNINYSFEEFKNFLFNNIELFVSKYDLDDLFKNKEKQSTFENNLNDTIKNLNNEDFKKIFKNIDDSFLEFKNYDIYYQKLNKEIDLEFLYKIYKKENYVYHNNFKKRFTYDIFLNNLLVLDIDKFKEYEKYFDLNLIYEVINHILISSSKIKIDWGEVERTIKIPNHLKDKTNNIVENIFYIINKYEHEKSTFYMYIDMFKNLTKIYYKIKNFDNNQVNQFNNFVNNDIDFFIDLLDSPNIDDYKFINIIKHIKQDNTNLNLDLIKYWPEKTIKLLENKLLDLKDVLSINLLDNLYSDLKYSKNFLNIVKFLSEEQKQEIVEKFLYFISNDKKYLKLNENSLELINKLMVNHNFNNNKDYLNDKKIKELIVSLINKSDEKNTYGCLIYLLNMKQKTHINYLMKNNIIEENEFFISHMEKLILNNFIQEKEIISNNQTKKINKI